MWTALTEMSTYQTTQKRSREAGIKFKSHLLLFHLFYIVPFRIGFNRTRCLSTHWIVTSLTTETVNELIIKIGPSCTFRVQQRGDIAFLQALHYDRYWCKEITELSSKVLSNSCCEQLSTIMDCFSTADLESAHYFYSNWTSRLISVNLQICEQRRHT